MTDSCKRPHSAINELAWRSHSVNKSETNSLKLCNTDQLTFSTRFCWEQKSTLWSLVRAGWEVSANGCFFLTANKLIPDHGRTVYCNITIRVDHSFRKDLTKEMGLEALTKGRVCRPYIGDRTQLSDRASQMFPLLNGRTLFQRGFNIEISAVDRHRHKKYILFGIKQSRKLSCFLDSIRNYPPSPPPSNDWTFP